MSTCDDSLHESPSTAGHDAWLMKTVEKARAREQKAFSILYDLYKDRICTYLTRLLGNSELAHDIAQETFIKAWQCLPQIRDTRKFKPWLYRIATNLAHSHRRSTKTLPHFSLEDRNNEYDVSLIVAPPDEQVSNAELVNITLSHLSEQQKTCLLLQHEGFTLREIAESLDINETHVSVLLCRGRERFRHVYQHLKGENR